MLEDVRKYVRAGMDAISTQRPDDLLGRVQGFADQMTALAGGLLEWSAEARASLLREVKDLVTRQIQEMGVATMQDLDLLRTRIDRLERGSAGAARAGGAAKREPAKKKAASGKGSSSSSRSTEARPSARSTAGRKRARSGSSGSGGGTSGRGGPAGTRAKRASSVRSGSSPG